MVGHQLEFNCTVVRPIQTIDFCEVLYGEDCKPITAKIESRISGLGLTSEPKSSKSCEQIDSMQSRRTDHGMSWFVKPSLIPPGPAGESARKA